MAFILNRLNKENKFSYHTMENNEEVVIDTTNDKGEGESETISIPKEEYDKLNQTLGSMKRELKDLKKPKEETKETPKEETKETPQKTNPSDNALLERMERLSCRQAGVTHPEDIELARKTAKKWDVDIDEVLADEDFKVKLEKQQTGRANVEATSNIKGGTGTSQAKQTIEYWKGKGVPPTPSDIPDRDTRQKIISQMLKDSKGGTGKKFYND